MTDIFTQDIKDLIKLATEDFDEFYKQTEKQDKASGDYSKAASSGYRSKAASSGDYSKAASSGSRSTAASSGNRSTASCEGKNAACSALGYRAAVKGDLGNLLMCSEYNEGCQPIGGKADLVDGKKLKPNRWYIVKGGEWVEVDFTDGLFHRVLYTRGSVKKIQDDNGDIAYLVTDGDKSAHGSTIKEARENLIYKIGNRDKSEYEGLKLTSKHTVPELIEMYRVITGACSYGVKSFIESQGKVKKSYTIKEIIALTKGQYGHEEFKGFFK